MVSYISFYREYHGNSRNLEYDKIHMSVPWNLFDHKEPVLKSQVNQESINSFAASFRIMGLLPVTQNRGLCMRRGCRERFPRHTRAVMHVGLAKPRQRGKLFRHSRCMRNPQFCVPGKRPIQARDELLQVFWYVSTRGWYPMLLEWPSLVKTFI